MSIEQPALSVPYLAEQGGFCADCPKARAFALDIVEAARAGKAIDPVYVVASFAVYISSCERKRPFPSPTDDEGSCMDVNEQRKCLHSELGQTSFEEKDLRLAEMLPIN